jgi:hypothetical protein
VCAMAQSLSGPPCRTSTAARSIRVVGVQHLNGAAVALSDSRLVLEDYPKTEPHWMPVCIFFTPLRQEWGSATNSAEPAGIVLRLMYKISASITIPEHLFATLESGNSWSGVEVPNCACPKTHLVAQESVHPDSGNLSA